MTTETIQAAVVGGTGYTGGETLRLLLSHPAVDVIETTSRSYPDTPVHEIHPNLRGSTDQYFREENLERLNRRADVVYLALPHGVSMEKVNRLNLDELRAIDLGADFRLRNPERYREVYEQPHAAPELLDVAVYGLTEFNRDSISRAPLVACPGCFPTGALLAVLPLVNGNLVEKRVIIDSKTGSSGSGRSPSSGTHHPERAFDFRAYKIFQHRHMEEILQEGNKRSGNELRVTFTPHSSPMVRGIFTTAYLTLTESMEEDSVRQVYRDAYREAPFVRLVENPRSAVVKGTNYCDLSVHTNGREVIVLSAIDNLLKGAAGQAVQNMNVMFDLPETTGLTFPGTHP